MANVESFALHVRGMGDPIPIIKSLCLMNNWVAVDYSNSTQIDFNGDADSGLLLVYTEGKMS
jgi:hypothetical protein